ncbi:MAG: diguanylate cyclase [Candidatus Omnitrophica bacterium]|nr:diguanylate cyclase [Candidatus Omnitrophota bacterium]
MDNMVSYMTTGIVQVDINITLLNAIKLMREKNIGAVLVEDRGDIKGIFTERDLLHKLIPAGKIDMESLLVSNFMSKDLITVPDDTSYLEVIKIMREKRVRHIPVTKNGKITGIVSMRDLTKRLHEYVEERTQEIEAARKTLEAEVEERKKAETELAKKVENLQILYSVSKALNFANDLNRVLLFILDRSRDALQAQKASLMLIDEKTRELAVKVVRGVPMDIEEKINSGQMECTRIKIGEGIAGQVAIQKQYILVDDVENDARFKQSGKSFVESILCMPLLVNDEVIGVINLTNKQKGGKFTREDADILSTLAGHSAVTIHNAKLYHLAITDGLTQLRIHRYFQQRLQEELIRSAKFNHPVSLIMSDIDHFKKFNDTYGHQMGDLVLMETAKLFRTNVRDVDIAARYGGEEFAIVMPETGKDEAFKMAEKLRKAVEAHDYPSQKGTLKVTVSLGVSTYPFDSTDKDELIKFADQALYRAKDGGRNQVQQAQSPGN